MSAPRLNTLPTAPAKIGNPDQFLNQSALFLQALPTYQTGINQLSTYLNTLKPNKFCAGTLTGTTPTQPVFDDIPDVVGVGSTFVDAVDTVYKHVHALSGKTTALGDFADYIATELGVVNTDTTRPSLTNVTAAPAKNQAVTVFNTTATNFTNSHRTLVTNLNAYCTYLNNLSLQDIDFGTISDTTISETVDAGSVTDTTYENTTT